MTKDKPVNVGEIYNVSIDNMGNNGEGIGKIEGFTIFVDDAIPGDSMNVEIYEVKKKFARGNIKKLLVSSLQRIKPRCSIASNCGGCQIQHMDYRWQLEHKAQKVEDSIERIAKLEDVVVHPTIGMEDPWGYRNKAQFPVGNYEGEIVVGFYEKQSHSIVDIDDCPVQHSANKQIVEEVKRYMEENNIHAYNEVTGEGTIRHIVTRVGFATGEIMVIIVAARRHLPGNNLLADRLVKKIPEVKSVVLNINDRKTNVILGKECITLWGQDYITDFIGNIQFRISPLSFFQVNPVQTRVLYNKALEYANLKGNETVIDAYCGTGTISLFLAQKAEKVYGIEVVEQAVEDARTNARMNGMDNVEFIAGKSEEIMPRLYKKGLRPEVVVVDPPRKGCETLLLDAIVSMQPERVVYVSCNPSTLARDLKYLDERGYKTLEIQPMDMFPHTAHVECVVRIYKK